MQELQKHLNTIDLTVAVTKQIVQVITKSNIQFPYPNAFHNSKTKFR